MRVYMSPDIRICIQRDASAQRGVAVVPAAWTQLLALGVGEMGT